MFTRRVNISRKTLVELYRAHGHLSYEGEGVDQLSHGWQCAALAARSGASKALCLAAFLHDVGHLFSQDDTPTLKGKNDHHEVTGAAYLARLLPEEVTEPIRLHVKAKRYLVATNTAYRSLLSMDSQRSLVLQGGAMGLDEQRHFIGLPFSQQALQLRVWDEQAKQANARVNDRSDMLADLARLLDGGLQ